MGCCWSRGGTCFWVPCSDTEITSFFNSLPFLKFATNEAIQRTEAYEYAQSLGAQTCSFPNFQVRGSHASPWFEQVGGQC